MAMAISSGLSRSTLPASRKTSGLFQRVAAGFAAYRARQRELAELARMSDRDLHDLSISRADFQAIAAGTFRRGV